MNLQQEIENTLCIITDVPKQHLYDLQDSISLLTKYEQQSTLFRAVLENQLRILDLRFTEQEIIESWFDFLVHGRKTLKYLFRCIPNADKIVLNQFKQKVFLPHQQEKIQTFLIDVLYHHVGEQEVDIIRKGFFLFQECNQSTELCMNYLGFLELQLQTTLLPTWRSHLFHCFGKSVFQFIQNVLSFQENELQKMLLVGFPKDFVNPEIEFLIRKTVWNPCMHELVERSCPRFFQEEDWPSLNQFMQTFHLATEENPNAIGQLFQSFLRSNTSSPFQTTIDSLFCFHKKIHEIVLPSLDNDSYFANLYISRLREVWKEKEDDFALTSFVESVVLTGERCRKEVESELEFAVFMSSCLPNPETFLETNRLNLAKRLLSSFAITELEKLFLTKLAWRFGNCSTMKSEAMLRDYLYSQENRLLDFQGNFSVLYLTSANWPTSPSFSSLSLPVEIKDCYEAFHRMHDDRFPSRKLQWIHSLGNVQLNVRWGKTKSVFTIETDPVRGSLLLLFNKRSKWTITELSIAINLSEECTIAILSSLSSSELPILHVRESRMVECNEEFASSCSILTSLKIEKQQDCSAMLDSVIVRIMKSRTQLTHVELMTEIMTSLKTKIEVANIHKRIDSLLDREYLQREQYGSVITYTYVP